jgi:hypothetical protein
MLQDIEIIQGSTFEWLLYITDVNGDSLDMSGYTGGTAGVRGAIRAKYGDVSPYLNLTPLLVVANKTGVIATGIHLSDLEIAELKLVAEGSCYIVLELTAAQTAAMAKGKYVYDIEIEDLTGFVFKPVMGSVQVLPQVTV